MSSLERRSFPRPTTHHDPGDDTPTNRRRRWTVVVRRNAGRRRPRRGGVVRDRDRLPDPRGVHRSGRSTGCSCLVMAPSASAYLRGSRRRPHAVAGRRRVRASGSGSAASGAGCPGTPSSRSSCSPAPRADPRRPAVFAPHSLNRPSTGLDARGAAPGRAEPEAVRRRAGRAARHHHPGLRADDLVDELARLAAGPRRRWSSIAGYVASRWCPTPGAREPSRASRESPARRRSRSPTAAPRPSGHEPRTAAAARRPGHDRVPDRPRTGPRHRRRPPGDLPATATATATPTSADDGNRAGPDARRRHRAGDHRRDRARRRTGRAASTRRRRCSATRARRPGSTSASTSRRCAPAPHPAAARRRRPVATRAARGRRAAPPRRASRERDGRVRRSPGPATRSTRW